MKFLAFLFLTTLITVNIQAQDKAMVPMTQQEQMEWLQWKSGGGNQSCLGAISDATSQGVASSLEAQANETNTLMGLSQKYFELEKTCGIQLRNEKEKLEAAQAEHEAALTTLPGKIRDQQEEYQDALRAIKKQCEASSGEVYRKWRIAVTRGNESSPQALAGKTRRINGYQNLFYKDCLARESTVDEMQSLARKLRNNTRKLQEAIDASAKKLSALATTLSNNQKQIMENCQKGKEAIDYQARLAENQAGAARSAARTNNFLGTLNTVSICVSGTEGALGLGFGRGNSPNTSQ